MIDKKHSFIGVKAMLFVYYIINELLREYRENFILIYPQPLPSLHHVR